MTPPQLQQTIRETAIKYGLNEEVFSEIEKKNSELYLKRLGEEALLLIGNEGVEDVKSIKLQKNISMENAILDYLQSNPERLSQFQQKLKELSDELMDSFFEEILNKISVDKRDQFIADLNNKIGV